MLELRQRHHELIGQRNAFRHTDAGAAGGNVPQLAFHALEQAEAHIRLAFDADPLSPPVILQGGLMVDLRALLGHGDGQAVMGRC